MNELSVIIITFNEEKNIGRCIDSVKDIADEIIVVDSFSTDDTERICRSKGARFYQHHFEGHIEQKNYSLMFTDFPYVLSLDADEALDSTLIRSIIEVKKKWKYDGYEMNRFTNYCGKWIKHCGWYPDRKLRLFNKRHARWGGNNPHDKLELEPGSNTLLIKGNILHYSYNTVEEHYRQIEYFTTISSKGMFQQGKRAPMIKLLFNPCLKFIKDYIFHLGFLDGYAGWQICRLSAWATYKKYAKLRTLYKA